LFFFFPPGATGEKPTDVNCCFSLLIVFLFLFNRLIVMFLFFFAAVACTSSAQGSHPGEANFFLLFFVQVDCSLFFAKDVAQVNYCFSFFLLV